MGHTYNVLTPCVRFGNLLPMFRSMEGYNFGPFSRACRVRWHVLIDDDVPFDINFRALWAKVYRCPATTGEGWQQGLDKLNWFLDQGDLKPDERYCVLCDDDLHEPGFFDKLDRHEGEVLVCSMLRGHQLPPLAVRERAHPTDPLIAAPENMVVCGVGMEQLVISGRLFAPMRYQNNLYADGILIQEATTRHPTTYVPDAYVLFNYLEPGRWLEMGAV